MKEEQLMLFAEEHHANHSPSQVCDEDSAMIEAILLSRFAEWLISCAPSTSSGKTLPDVCHLTKDGTLPETLETALRSLISNELGSTEPRA